MFPPASPVGSSASPHGVNRRQFLRSGSAVLALPFLEALAYRPSSRASMPKPPKRMVCIMTDTGLLAENFFPKGTGRNFVPLGYLGQLEPTRPGQPPSASNSKSIAAIRAERVVMRESPRLTPLWSALMS